MLSSPHYGLIWELIGLSPDYISVCSAVNELVLVWKWLAVRVESVDVHFETCYVSLHLLLFHPSILGTFVNHWDCTCWFHFVPVTHWQTHWMQKQILISLSKKWRYLCNENILSAYGHLIAVCGKLLSSFRITKVLRLWFWLCIWKPPRIWLSKCLRSDSLKGILSLL